MIPPWGNRATVGNPTKCAEEVSSLPGRKLAVTLSIFSTSQQNTINKTCCRSDAEPRRRNLLLGCAPDADVKVTLLHRNHRHGLRLQFESEFAGLCLH